MTAKIPAKDQLTEAIKDGNDNFDNCLVLNQNGNFHVVPLTDFKRYDTDNDYIARNEDTYARHGYVGVGASRDVDFINETYLEFLMALLQNLTSGETKILCDNSFTIDKTEQELLNAIEKSKK